MGNLAAWILIAVALAVLWIFWRLLNFAGDLIGRALEQSDAPFGAPLLDTAHEVGSWKREEATREGGLSMRCICRKGAVDPLCPRHGWERA